MKADFITNVLYGKAGKEGCKEMIREGITGIMMKSLMDVIEEEVIHLCGPRYHPEKESAYQRGGNAPGRIYMEGRTHSIKKPRVREKDGREVTLTTYECAKDARRIVEDTFRAYSAGVSCRETKVLHPGSKGFSSSQVNRRWIESSIHYLEELRGRKIGDEPFVVLMIDGIILDDSLVVLFALGIHSDGRKKMLDFEIGAQENQEVCRGLLNRLEKRGVHFGGRPMFVLDGSEALDLAVKKAYKDPVIQRCLVHKENNLRRCLSKKDYSELARLMNRLRRVQGPDAAREALNDLRKFLSGKNKQALDSLNEAGELLISLQLLNVPATLNVSLLSTNIIENPIRNFRSKTRRVTRWRPQTDMSERWSAYAMLTVEQGFRRIWGHEDLPALLKALGWKEHVQEAA